MRRRLPLLPTLIVALAVAAMISLGVWQLQRLKWKEGLIARSQAAQAMNSDVPWPTDQVDYANALYRHSTVDCDRVVSSSAIAGRSAEGEAGWAQVAQCELDGGKAQVALGWSRDPAPVTWSGGKVPGIVAPAGKGLRLVAAPPQAGLQQLAPPDPLDMPNNHLSYAVQWFLFAATAVVIYGLALRKRWREKSSPGRGGGSPQG